MMMMGFDSTLSSAALKKCNNQSLEAAIDSVIEIQKSIEDKFKTSAPSEEARPSAEEEPAPKLSEAEQKRADILQNGRIEALEVAEIKDYAENTLIRYKIQAVVHDGKNALVFVNSL